jgi:proline dehydrogenase
MLSSILLRTAQNRRLAASLGRSRAVGRAARRFLPGEALEDALAAARRLSDEGLLSVLTLLGENVETAEAARQATDAFERALVALAEAGLEPQVSVKPTHLGLDLGTREALGHLRALTARAGHLGGLVWIDMEGSAYAQPTLELFRSLRETGAEAGLCLQAYLRRTPADLESLLPLAPRIRLVKGAYREPSQVAFQKKRDVDAAYLALSRTLLKESVAGRAHPAFATHDLDLLRRIEAAGAEHGLGPGAYEVQMLYGVRSADQVALASDGHKVRVLISYGSEWFAWYMRRLAERPSNVAFALRAMLG